jgi:hypothetical protein
MSDFRKQYQKSLHKTLRAVRLPVWRIRTAFLQARAEPPPENLHRTVVEWSHAAYPLLSGAENVEALLQRVAEKQGQSPKTAYKWLCERNPMYEPGGSMERRWKCLRIAVLRTYAHIPPP